MGILTEYRCILYYGNDILEEDYETENPEQAAHLFAYEIYYKLEITEFIVDVIQCYEGEELSSSWKYFIEVNYLPLKREACSVETKRLAC